MSNPTIETTEIPLHENTNDNAAPTAPVDSIAPALKASRGKSPTESSQPPAAKPHCRHRVRTGAYCRLPVSDPKTGLCFRHASLRLEEVDSGDLSEELVCGIKEFHSAVNINHVLGELYKLLAANKISPRRGAVMAYTCNLLLRTPPLSTTNSILPLPTRLNKSCSISLAPSATDRRPAMDAVGNNSAFAIEFQDEIQPQVKTTRLVWRLR